VTEKPRSLRLAANTAHLIVPHLGGHPVPVNTEETMNWYYRGGAHFALASGGRPVAKPGGPQWDGLVQGGFIWVSLVLSIEAV